MKELDILYVSFFSGLFFFLIQCLLLMAKYNLNVIKDTFFNKIGRNLYFSLFVASLVYAIMVITWLYLLKYTNVSRFIPVKTGMLVVFSIVLAVLTFNENIDMKKALGVGLIVAGILLIGEIKS